jgi:hypothetical protein
VTVLLTADGADYFFELFSGEPAVESYHVALIGPVAPGLTAGGYELEEPQAANYIRAQMPNDSAAWAVLHGGIQNVEELSFTIADEDWGEIQYWAVCDSAEGGRVFWIGEFSEPFYVQEGQQVTIPESALTLKFDLFGWS